MLATDPKQTFEELKDQLIAQVSSTFPVRDRKGAVEVRVKDLSVTDDLDIDDINAQFRARMDGKSWASPLTGTIEVVDVATDKVLVSKRATLAKIPKLTRHYSYIIGGQEKFISNQWRLRPGPYVRATEKPGEFRAQFQLAKGKRFDIESGTGGYLHMNIGGRKVPLYSVLSSMGVEDSAMRSSWGDAAFEASKSKARPDKDLRSLYQAWKGSALPATSNAVTVMHDLFASTKLDPEVAEANTGVNTGVVDKALLLAASKKLIDVSSDRKKPDPIDSLRYKELWTAKDHFSERIEQSRGEIERRIQQALSRPKLMERVVAGDHTALRDVFMPDLIQKPLYGVFTTTLSSNGKQTNPLTMLSDRSLTTIMGPGGIQNQHQISQSNTALDPSHLGFLDPVFTPESNAGVNAHLAFGVTVKDRKPMVRMYNVRTKKMEDVDAVRASMSRVALPDQVTWSGGTPTPRGKTVRMSDGKGQIHDATWGDAQYVMASATQVFALETNLVPFMGNDSAGRSAMSSRHMSQAISVVGREAPLVQVEAGGGRSFEEIVGSNFLAHKAPVDGTVTAVRRDGISIKDSAGKLHEVSLYHHYPTNDQKGQLHSTASVRPGDTVKAGQLVAENNYTRGGRLALGTNLRTAYLADGFNHEDGLTISESGAKKLASEHLYKPELQVTDDHIIDKRSFIIDKPAAFHPDRLKNIGDDGVVKPGTKVSPGDPLILALRHDRRLITSGTNAMAKIGKRLKSVFNNNAVVWDSDYSGEVVRAERSGNSVVVHVKTLEPVQVGSKLSTRHSAKGIVSAVKPDHEMPRDDAGKHVELLINSVSVPGRQNVGQLLETVAGKIAEKTGKPYLVKNFVGGVDYLDKVQRELKSHGLSDTDVLHDPKTGRRLGPILTGPHYVFQLEHQIDKKTHVRGGGPSFAQLESPNLPYDPNTLVPRGGGHHGGQSLGALGIYSALASGLKDNLHEMGTLKADQPQAKAVWEALTNGTALPTPKIPFVYKNFEAMLAGLGVAVHNSAGTLRLMPMNDKEILQLSRGEILRPKRVVRGKDDKPESGGLFDIGITGGEGGQHWGHIRLAEPMPNPVYARAIAHTLGIKESDIPEIIEGKKKLPGGQYGGKGFREALEKLDLDKELAAAKSRLDDPSVRGSELNKTHFKYKALHALKDAGKTPAEAWTIQNVPVLPPIFRPITTMTDGSVKNHPLNSLYRRLGAVNDALKAGEKIPYNVNADTRAGLYQELENVFGTVPKGKKALDLDIRGTSEDRSKKLPGLLHIIAGENPKDGFFQDKMIGKKQDYTARATIVGDPNLGIDDLGVPRKIAMELFRNMVVGRLIRGGMAGDKAQLAVSRKTPEAMRVLEHEVKLRPVLFKRDPVLHAHGVLGQNIILTNDAAIKVNPLIMPPLGADVDGDAAVIMVPLSTKAVEEVKTVMPSRRLISDASGEVIYTPTNEGALSLYRMSIPRGKTVSFISPEAAEKAFISNRIDLNSRIKLPGGGDTTLGRHRIAAILPEKYKHVVKDINVPFGRKEQSGVLRAIAKDDPKHFVDTINGMSQLGFKMAYESGHTISLADVTPLRGPRDAIISETAKQIMKDRARGEAVNTTARWLDATRQIHTAYDDHFKLHPTNVSDMAVSGIKAKTEQFQGLIMAPMLVEDHRGKPSAVPITKSFAEGIDVGGYFLQAAGARRGVIQKTKSVSEPGYLSKLLVQANLDQAVSAQDCGTTSGIAMGVKERDVVDRHLAAPLTLNGHTYPAGTVVTPDLLATAEHSRVSNLTVRSPLKCRAPHGVCSVCMGVHPSGGSYAMGENVGIIAAQAIGERAAQLMLKQTHGAGIVSTKVQGVEGFGDVQALFKASPKTREHATIAPGAGTVTSVDKTHHGTWMIGLSDRKPVEANRAPLAHVKPGHVVVRGETLTHGDPSIHDLLDTKGLEAVQSHMVDRIGKIYSREGVLRRHVELAIRTATGLVRVTDPGATNLYVRGDYVQKPVVDEVNRHALEGKAQIKYESMLKTVGMNPLYQQPDWMGRLQGERSSQNLMTGIQHSQSSNVGGRHPIPAIATGARVR